MVTYLFTTYHSHWLSFMDTHCRLHTAPRPFVSWEEKLYGYLSPHAVNCVRLCFWRCLWLFLWRYFAASALQWIVNGAASAFVRLYVWKNIFALMFGQPFVKRFALCYRTVVCPISVSLSVTLVYCGQTVGWIEMKLGTEVGLGPGHIRLDGDPAPSPPQKEHSPQFSTNVCCR